MVDMSAEDKRNKAYINLIKLLISIVAGDNYPATLCPKTQTKV